MTIFESDSLDDLADYIEHGTDELAVSHTAVPDLYLSVLDVQRVRLVEGF